MKLLLLLSSLYLSLCLCASNSNCSSESPCSCVFSTGEEITLSGYSSDEKKPFVSANGGDGNTYRFYPCGAETPWTADGDCVKADAACQHSTGEDIYYSLGKAESYSIEEAVLDGEQSYVKFKYTGGTLDRMSTVKVICSESEGLSFLEEYPNLEYNLELTSKRGCPVNATAPAAGGNAPGLFIFVILVLFLAIVTYVVVGMMLMVFWKGARGLEIIPNLGFWKDLPFLLKDGFLFTFACFPTARDRIGGQRPYSSLK